LTKNNGKLQRVTPVLADLPDLNSLDSNALKALLVEKHMLILEQRVALEERHHEIERPGYRASGTMGRMF
jgi:hypothetical protein